MPKPVKVKPARAGFRTFTAKVFEVAARHLGHDPIPLSPITVSARSEDEARGLIKQELSKAGRSVRALSSSQRAADEFLAYTTPLPTGPTALRSPPRR